MKGALIGRDAEVSRIRDLMDGGGCCAIWGPPGTGKSHLALESIRDRRHRRLDFHGLLSGLELLAEAIAQREGAEILIVDGLDDVDDLDGCVELVRRQPGIIVTSRQRFPIFESIELHPLTRSQARAMWSACVHEAIGTEEPASVEEILDFVGQLPLAIAELAASRSFLDPESILTRLEGDARSLFGGEVIEKLAASYDQLDGELRSTLAQACAFESWFDATMPSAVLEVQGDPVLAVRSLIERGLLDAQSTPNGRRARVPKLSRMLIEQLDPPELRAAERRHSEYCVGVASKGTIASTELLSAARFLVGESDARAADALGAIDLVALDTRATRDFLELISRTLRNDDGTREIELRAARASALRRLQRTEESRHDIDRALALCSKDDRRSRGRLLAELGALQIDEGLHRDALKTLCDARDELASVRDANRMSLGIVLARRGEALQELDRFEESLGEIEKSYLMFTQAGNVARELGALLTLGVLRLSLGRLDAAASAFRESEERARAESLPYYKAYARFGHALVAHVGGTLDAALGLYARADRSLSQHGTRRDAGRCATYWALALHERGLLDEASLRARRACELTEGFTRAHAIAVATCAGIEADLGLSVSAESRLTTLRALATESRALGWFIQLRAAHLHGTHPGAADVASFEVALAERILAGVCGRVDLSVSRDGREFITSAESVSLRRRRALRRILAGLAASRERQPGRALSVDDLFELGWPDAKIGPEHASNRVYNAVSELRSLGLSDFLIRRDDGYLLDPDRTFALH